MKAIIFILLFSILLSSCSHRIIRSGYKVNKSDYRNCEITIKKFTEIPDSVATNIGEIKLGESGFAMACSEEHALEILHNEACAINSDLIVITEENRPDLWSSCYRCRAKFYKYNSKVEIDPNYNDETYKESTVKQRVSEDRKQNTFVAILAVTFGFVVGFLLFQ